MDSDWAFCNIITDESLLTFIWCFLARNKSESDQITIKVYVQNEYLTGWENSFIGNWKSKLKTGETTVLLDNLSPEVLDFDVENDNVYFMQSEEHSII